ncbi:uncharacterized protein LOC123869085 [Maniola jurtina]|uniref:uncharacterized protein LOC123869085 n=1 Tax=Maniola jurtina TaxID=191418 RepID=UPI001E68CFE1|nr:uncharacterized protein LOC123869085 [Maniola jurtina]
MYYLLGKLTGKALSACSGITPCAENYSLLLQTLIDKYDDKRMIAATYLDQLLEFKSISASADNFDLFIEKFVAAYRGLKNLKLPDLTDFIVLHIALKKIDSDSIRTFERLGDSSSIPTFEDLVNFIKNQSKIMQRLSPASPSSDTKKIVDRGSTANKKNASSQKLAFVTTVDNNKPAVKCLCDNITHQHLFKCPRFVQASPEERFQLVKQCNACVNCLSNKHNQVSRCNSNTNCKKCNLRHSTWLHITASDSNPTTSSGMPDTVTTEPLGTAPAASSDAQAPLPAVIQPVRSAAVVRTGPTVTLNESVVLCTRSIAASQTSCNESSSEPREQCNMPTSVLLATAQVIVYDSKGNTHLLRCLLDTAAEANFISADCCTRLNIRQNDTLHTIVKGFGGSEKPISKSVSVQLHSKYNTNIKFDISALVVDHITENLPSSLIDKDALAHLSNLHLADNAFASPSPIDMLIGSSLFPHLLLPGVVLGKPSEPSAIHTVFGYVLMGSAPALKPTSIQSTTTACLALVRSSSTSATGNLNNLQELTCASVQGSVGHECERLSSTITARVSVGDSHSIAIPFRKNIFTIGNSSKPTYEHLLCLQRKPKAYSQLRLAYNEVYREYLRNNYIPLSPRVESDRSRIPTYLSTHHDVIREDKSSATKLQVVADDAGTLSSSANRFVSLHEPPRALLAPSQLPIEELDGISVSEIPEQKLLSDKLASKHKIYLRAELEITLSALRPSS